MKSYERPGIQNIQKDTTQLMLLAETSNTREEPQKCDIQKPAILYYVHWTFLTHGIITWYTYYYIIDCTRLKVSQVYRSASLKSYTKFKILNCFRITSINKKKITSLSRSIKRKFVFTILCNQITNIVHLAKK